MNTSIRIISSFGKVNRLVKIDFTVRWETVLLPYFQSHKRIFQRQNSKLIFYGKKVVL
jgi:hypothetical protein